MARANYCPKYKCIITSETCPYCNEVHGRQAQMPKTAAEKVSG